MRLRQRRARCPHPGTTGEAGIRAICLRCAGSNNVDLAAARQLGLRVLNVPGYAPESVAEFTLALLLNLGRHLQQSQLRVRQNNFDLSGLVGVQLHGKTAGVVGTGRIGSATALLLKALGMTVLAHDPHAPSTPNSPEQECATWDSQSCCRPARW